METVTIARVYLREQEHLLDKITRYLHEEAEMRGMTVFRGITGFGDTGAVQTSRFMDLALDLPLVVEFFDTQGKIEKALTALKTFVKPEHIITWEAHCY